jgi:4-hydroxy-3-polyprenylbenzoate decarboxylase
MRVLVAITGASGAIYARQAVEMLIANDSVEAIGIIYSDNAPDVLKAEGVTIPTSQKIVNLANDDMWSSAASGSSRWNAMIIIPASMGTCGRIAAGISRTLIERAADVMLKQRHRLVVVVREAPYSLIHLRNMVTLTEAGAVVIPASPSFYFNPTSIEELCLTITTRAIEMAGVNVEHKHWGE